MTTFRLTPQALALVEERGVQVAHWPTHWRLKGDQVMPAPKGAPVLFLRSTRERFAGKKADAVDLPFDHKNPDVAKIETGVKALNAFLEKQEIGNISFRGLRRIFNEGDQRNYEWNKGGRYYSIPGGHTYERRGSEWRRSVITINSEAVDEVDLRASHLTLLHALLGEPFDPREDPYGLPDLPRALVKAWVSQAIGASNPRPRQWSARVQAEYEEERPGQWLQDHFVIREVGAAVQARHPLLIELKACGLGPLDLQFHEAEILRLAMEDLMLKQGIPVLPMHDAIIAPRSALGQAQEALERAFASHVNAVTGHRSVVLPKVTCKGGAW